MIFTEDDLTADYSLSKRLKKVYCRFFGHRYIGHIFVTVGSMHNVCCRCGNIKQCEGIKL